MQRRLAAIMFADIVGYSRLVGENEAQTLEAIGDHKRQLVDPLIANSGSRFLKQIGDGFLIDFMSAVDALRFAIELQTGMVQRNQSKGEGPRIQYRIGLNLGEIVVQDDDVYGDVVNVAARLQELSEPNGICITEQVYDEVVGKVDCHLLYLGELQLKNIVHAVRVFKWLPSAPSTERAGTNTFRPRLPRVPSVAVLQFESAKEDAFIANGLTEDITTELGRFSDLLVIASDSALQVDKQGTPFRQLGHELGAQFVVKGSIRRMGETFAVTAILYSCDDGTLLWSGKYRGSFSDIFAMQTQVANDIATSLPSRIEKVRLQRAVQRPTDSLDAYECYLRGRALYRQKSRTRDSEARALLQRAIEIDEEYADPYATLGAIVGSSWSYSQWGVDPMEAILKGRKKIRKALRLNRSLPHAHAHFGWNLLYTGDFAQAEFHISEAERLNPNDPDVLTLRAYALCYLGRPEESLHLCRRLMRLNPRYPDWYLDILATAQFLTMQYEEALITLDNVPDFFPENSGWAAAASAHLGRMEDASQFAKRFIENVRPIWKGSTTASNHDYVNWMLQIANPFCRTEDRKNLADGLIKCGLAT